MNEMLKFWSFLGFLGEFCFFFVDFLGILGGVGTLFTLLCWNVNFEDEFASWRVLPDTYT